MNTKLAAAGVTLALAVPAACSSGGGTATTTAVTPSGAVANLPDLSKK